jgi:hypothetical protein
MTGTLRWTPSTNAIGQDIFLGRNGNAPEYINVNIAMSTASFDLTFGDGEKYEIYILSYGPAGQRVQSVHISGTATVPVVPVDIQPATGLSMTFHS